MTDAHAYRGLRLRPNVDELIPYTHTDNTRITLPGRTATILYDTHQLNALTSDTITYSQDMEERIEHKLRNEVPRDYASSNSVSTAHAQAVVSPTCPSQQFDIASEPNLEACTAHED